MHYLVEKPDCNWAAGLCTANALQGHGEGGPSPPGPPPSPSPTRSVSRSLPPFPSRSSTDEKQQHGDRRPPRGTGRASHGHTAALGSAVGPGHPLHQCPNQFWGAERAAKTPRHSGAPCLQRGLGASAGVCHPSGPAPCREMEGRASRPDPRTHRCPRGPLGTEGKRSRADGGPRSRGSVLSACFGVKPRKQPP